MKLLTHRDLFRPFSGQHNPRCGRLPYGLLGIPLIGAYFAETYRSVMETRTTSGAGFSIPSIIAIVAAIWSFFAGPAAGFALAMVAIAAGIIGVVLSLSPNVRGGLVSILSLMIGAVAILVAVVRAIGRVL